MKKTKVVNIYKEPYDVYIGRAGHGQDGYYGNPYDQYDRKTNIEMYKKYFYKRMSEDNEFRTRIMDLKGKTLGCFCRPEKECHGDIIADFLNNIKPVSMAVIGSRTFEDYEYMKNILRWYDIKRIVSGGAKGADSLAKKYAEENGIKVKEFLPEWKKFGKKAGFLRNKQIINDADEVIAFWDGKSKGTLSSISLAKEAGKPVYVYWPEDELSDF